MTLFSDDLTTFFHMRNHYMKLRKAKSTFVFSSKERVKSSCSLLEKQKGMANFEKKHSHLPFYDNRSSSLTCLYDTEMTGNLSLVRVPRPRTRRNPKDLPPPQQKLKPRSLSLSDGRISYLKLKKHKSNSNKKCYSDLDSKESTSIHNNEHSNFSTSRKSLNLSTSKNSIKEKQVAACSESKQERNCDDITYSSASPSRNTKSNNKVEEHEYLQFLLRVTEDIILNNYYTNEDIERVFKDHMDMNKDTLIKEKMEQHLAKLADELNIADSQTTTQSENYTLLSKPHPSYTNIQALKPIEEKCASVPLDLYLYPSLEYNYYNRSYQNNLDEIIYNRHSLGRVTECTEPSNSSTTVTKVISSCTTKSDIAVLNCSNQLNEQNLKLDHPSSKIFIVERTDTKDSLSPFKILRSAVSENIVHHHQKLVDNVAFHIDNEDLDKKANSGKKVMENFYLEIDGINRRGNPETVNSGFKADKSGFIIEKVKSDTPNNNIYSEKIIVSSVCEDNINSRDIKQINGKKCDTDSDDFYTKINNAKDYIIDRFNSENSQINLKKKYMDKNLKSTTLTDQVIDKEFMESKFQSEKINIFTDSSVANADKFDDMTVKSRHSTRSKFSTGKDHKETESSISIANADVDGLNVDRVNLSTETEDYVSERNISNPNKTIAEKGHFNEEEKSNFGADKDEESSFNSNLGATPGKLYDCDLRLDLNFTQDSIDAFYPTPYVAISKSNAFIETDIPREIGKLDITMSDSRKQNNYHDTFSKPREIDKAVQTSFNKPHEAEKPEIANKSTQVSNSVSNKKCSTDDFTIDQNEYVLVKNPIYVLKSALHSFNKIVIEKNEFLGSEKMANQLEYVERESDLESVKHRMDGKLLGSDYDLTPERDTTDKCHNRISDVFTTSRTSLFRIPSSISSVQEESLLLGNLYDLNETSSQEIELGSNTYRCIDNTKALSCDDDIFLRHSELIVSKNWLSDRSEKQKPSPKKRSKFKYLRAQVNIANSTSSTSLTN